jgi:spore maturation protein CgeB
MKLLVVGADSNYAIERPYVRYLAANPLIDKVDFFAAQNRFLAYYQKSLLHKILYRSGLSNILDQINSELIASVRHNKPDVILVFKGMEIFPETLQWLRGQDIKLANYNPDNPFIFSGQGSGNINITKSIALYDLHLTYDADVQKRITTDFGIRCEILPFGFDLDDRLYRQCQQEAEVIRACFVGNPDSGRSKFLMTLATAGVELDVYGHQWNKHLNHPNIRIFNGVFGDMFWKTLAQYRVQLNLMRIHNPHSHNMRSFEVPGVGGILLAPDTADHRHYFQPGSEIFLFKSVNECSDVIKHLLALPLTDALKIREASRSRSINSGYRYEDRAAVLANYLNSVR